MRLNVKRRLYDALPQGQEVVCERTITDGNGNVKASGIVAAGHQNRLKSWLLRRMVGVNGKVKSCA